MKPDMQAHQELEAARTRLLAKGLLKDGDSLSRLLPASREMLVLVQGADASVGPSRIALDGTRPALPLHGQLYGARSDAGAVLLARLPWAGALSVSGETMPGVFDEQLRHLGLQVAPIEAFNAAAVADGANAYLTSQGVLCLGMTLERLVFNVELLEKCAKAFVLARTSGHRIRTLPWLVRWVATSRLRRDQRCAAEYHARGQVAPRTAGY